MITPLRRDNRGKAPRRALYSRTFYQFLPTAPRAPDREQARVYLQAIHKLIERGGWTRAEWAGIRRLERRWARRVAGEDARWEVVGAKAGRLVRELEDALKPLPDPAWSAPLKKGGV